MCTAFQCHGYFGRNLDLETGFQEEVVVTPRFYNFPFKNGTDFKNQYALIGMATVVEDYPLYAEAMNEKGLCMAGLYFPDNAHYFDPEDKKLNLTPFELIPYLLGQYQSVYEIKSIIHQLHIIHIPFLPQMPLAPLHWIIADQNESLILESTKDGLQVYEDSLHILTNNPPYPYHQWNVHHYMHLTSAYPQDHLIHQNMKPYGNGLGTVGLPGDYSPASRFIKALWLKDNAKMSDCENENVSQIFHILDAVAMVKGSVKTSQNKDDYTIYSCCMSMNKLTYYYKTYNNNQIQCIQMDKLNLQASQLYIFILNRQQNIQYYETA